MGATSVQLSDAIVVNSLCDAEHGRHPPAALTARFTDPSHRKQLLSFMGTTFALPSSRHHLSYDDCLQNKRGNCPLFCAVLCALIVHSDTHTHRGCMFV